EAGVKDVFVHAFMDGRDCDPKSGKDFVAELQNHLAISGGKIASLTGRYYAMDRDKRWDRVRLAYDAMVKGIGEKYVAAEDIQNTIQESYDADITDEFLKPIVVTENEKPVGV
ncbi:MAG: 2,3-bisphosphoglycerate-independent phosphoglycerate mutase, partial [Spirosomaceae bacterium]|nr:2,3-bisphosphoglycerate-independent phosphoglycerate mutase [Spirosomataceae bacterium]